MHEVIIQRSCVATLYKRSINKKEKPLNIYSVKIKNAVALFSEGSFDIAISEGGKHGTVIYASQYRAEYISYADDNSFKNRKPTKRGFKQSLALDFIFAFPWVVVASPVRKDRSGDVWFPVLLLVSVCVGHCERFSDRHCLPRDAKEVMPWLTGLN